jgi:hypothetical protein
MRFPLRFSGFLVSFRYVFQNFSLFYIRFNNANHAPFVDFAVTFGSTFSVLRHASVTFRFIEIFPLRLLRNFVDSVTVLITTHPESFLPFIFSKIALIFRYASSINCLFRYVPLRFANYSRFPY